VTKSRIANRLVFLLALALLNWVVGDCRARADDPPKVKDPRAAYFPKVTLRNQNGKIVEFYDDLIKGKIVLINFMYTRCDGKLCGEGTENLVKVQKALGDRLGREVFMYSITLDPEHDTPDVLKDYAKTYGAHWTFLTGKTGKAEDIKDITNLRRKLGLFKSDAKADADLKQHTGMLTIGNASLDKWNKTAVLCSPDRILQMIERIKPPASPKK
jgi:protein SCO1/2